MATKVDLIQGAYSQMRISGLTVTPSPEDISVALDRLEDMMDEFYGKNVCLGYNFEENPDVNSSAGIKRKYNHMAKTNLAVRLIPDFNKVVPNTLMLQATQSYSAVSGMVAADNIREVQASRRMPRGSGNTLRYNRWQRFNRPDILPPNECETNNMLEGEVNDYTESFASYLEGETIASFTIASSSALTVNSSSNTDEIVSYRITAGDPVTTGSAQSVTIVITTSSGRIEQREIAFLVTNNE